MCYFIHTIIIKQEANSDHVEDVDVIEVDPLVITSVHGELLVIAAEKEEGVAAYDSRVSWVDIQSCCETCVFFFLIDPIPHPEGVQAGKRLKHSS